MQARRYGTERLGALSDGLFAILLTLLVLELKVPELPAGAGQQELVEDLAAQLPNAVAWLVSFLLIARFWSTHHSVMASLKECHRGTIAFNFFLLALVSLVPFGSSLIGTYEFEPVAILIFSLLIGGAGLALGLFCRHVALSPELHVPAQPADLDWHWRYNVYAIPTIALCAAALGFVVPALALLVWISEPFVSLALATRRVQPSVPRADHAVAAERILAEARVRDVALHDPTPIVGPPGDPAARRA